jgi:hypothetical protein
MSASAPTLSVVASISCVGPSRFSHMTAGRVADVYDPDPVPSHRVEDFVAIVKEERDANAGPLNNRAPTQWRPCNLGHNLLNARQDTFGDGRIAERS